MSIEFVAERQLAAVKEFLRIKTEEGEDAAIAWANRYVADLTGGKPELEVIESEETSTDPAEQ